MSKTSYQDVTERSAKMPRGSSLLYKNKRPKDSDSPSYYGLLKMPDGTRFWALVWPRTVRGQIVLELKLARKE
jgi:hypothetical protein